MTAAATDDDHAAARHLAEDAGSLLLRLRADHPPGAALRSAGDAESHRFLLRELQRRYPVDAILSEETLGATEERDRSDGRVWIVDPLDGTREFGEPPRSDWAVHVALVVDGRPAVGAVALPGRGLTLSTGAPLPPPAAAVVGRPPRVLVSRTRPPARAVDLARRMDGELVPLGSAGAKAMAVVLDEADVYVHAGGQYEWDSAAPVAVALAAGFHASRVDGSPLVYDQPNPWLPDLLVCHPRLADLVLDLWPDLTTND